MTSTNLDSSSFSSRLFGLLETNYLSLTDNYSAEGYTDLIFITQGSRKHPSLTQHDLVPRNELRTLVDVFHDQEQTIRISRLESVVSFFKRNVERRFAELDNTLAMYETAMSLVLETQNLIIKYLLNNHDYLTNQRMTITALARIYAAYCENDILMGNPKYYRTLSDFMSTIALIPTQPNLTELEHLALKALLRLNTLYLNLLSGERRKQEFHAPTIELVDIDSLLNKLNNPPVLKKGFFKEQNGFTQEQFEVMANEFYEQTRARCLAEKKIIYRYCALPNTLHSIICTFKQDFDPSLRSGCLLNLANEIALLNSDKKEDLQRLNKRKKMHINRAAKYLNEDAEFKALLQEFVNKVVLESGSTV